MSITPPTPTETNPRTVVVAGATGRLGIIANVLLARGHCVRAMTREPEGRAGRRLQRIGAEIVYGDYEDPGSIAAAARGADALFATGTAHRGGPDGELRHGLNVAEAAVAAGIPHLVYCSGDGAGENSPVPLFRVKHEVEERIRSLGIPSTILAPVYFMENLFNPWNIPALRAGRFPSPIPVAAPLQQVAIADLAAFAAIVIERPSEFTGVRMQVASDELNATDAADAISSVIERPLQARQIRTEELPPGLRALFGWLEHRGHAVDIRSLRSRYPMVDWHRYPDWTRSRRQRLIDLCPHPARLLA